MIKSEIESNILASLTKIKKICLHSKYIEQGEKMFELADGLGISLT